MSNEGCSTPPISVPPSGRQRRASIASGLGFPEYRSGSQGLTGPPPSSMANAMANAQSNQRRLSITTLGLSGSPTQTSPFSNRNFRHGSISSSVGSNPANLEEAVSEEVENMPPTGTTSPFARRVSFGAQALREARGGSIGTGRYPPPPSRVTGGEWAAKCVDRRHHLSVCEGFNWSEALRARAERGPVSPNSSSTQPATSLGSSPHHQRAASIASMDQPSRQLPKQNKQNKPDFFQEKILRGDFMD
ncbi:hypothetical protein ARAM_003323 [Aspergillus rambellii]|uniref:Uncharacterized protein n=1 Tax=Aspergillus rambellii TaxID=308745 RepID=A0A0F8X396_9EURO|nr:hypothetical protein ARAM_003323 [Aspergillus rambellii]